MEELLKEVIDRLAGIAREQEIQGSMIASIAEELDARRHGSEEMKRNVGAQFDFLKQMMESNPMMKDNPILKGMIDNLPFGKTD